jgi:response regulator RpfG family c-di-GMP phosphodiesterase
LRSLGRHVGHASSTPTAVVCPRILVVDDKPDLREYICESIAQGTSYSCVGVGDPRAAVQIARQQRVDVALVDLSMPEEDGITLARRLRDEIRDLPVVLITATRSFDAAVEAMRIGVLDYLLKPFVMPELLDVLDRAVEWRQAALHARTEYAELQRQIAARASLLRDTFSDEALGSSAALHTLLETLNGRATELFSHARRVAGFAVAVARRLGLAEPLVGSIERGALLHDLGKIAIPDAVMYKSGPLTSDEFAIVRSHPRIGHDIAATVPFLRGAADVILASHERYDGTGYPRGLKGRHIPIGARIVAVVDVFDALTSSRLDRDPVCIDEANAELVRAAGSHFDPDVVAAWLRSVDQCLAAADWWRVSSTAQ